VDGGFNRISYVRPGGTARTREVGCEWWISVPGVEMPGDDIAQPQQRGRATLRYVGFTGG